MNARFEVTLLALVLLAAAFEGVGIGMLLPIVHFIQKQGDIAALAADSQLWARILEVFQYFEVPVTLGALIAFSFSCIVLRQGVSYARQLYYLKLRENLVFNACNTGFHRYLEADAAYHDRESSGSVVNSLTTELRMAVDAILTPVQILSFALMTAFYVVLLLLITGPVTVAVMAVLGIVIFALRNLLSKTRKSGRQLAEANENMSAFLVQRLKSVRLVRLSGTEAAELTDMRSLTKRQRDSTVYMKTYLARVNVLMEPIAIGVSLVMLYIGVQFLDIGIEEIGVFALVAMMRLMPTVNEIVRGSQTFLAFLGSLLNFERRLDNMIAAHEQRGGEQMFEGLHGSIKFRDVGFHYDTKVDTPAIHQLNLEILAGRMTALVGPSGAGKSTLIDLLPRLRDPTEGVIMFDGQPLLEYSVESLRSEISYVSQLPVIFNVTVAAHIRYGKPDASDLEVREAAALAGAADFIEALPNGYDTMLGEEGVRLSGGQRQRLDLARALVRKASILILDEPTSNLDAEAEERFRDALSQIRDVSDATIIVVAHRLSTIAAADKIITLEDGRVTATGGHAELLAGGGWYANAYAQQMAGDRQPKAAAG